MKRALLSGVTGQDGSYLAEFLLDKDYEVHGTLRRSSSFNTGRIDHIFDKLHLHYADLTDASCISRLVREVRPDEIYHLAAQSHVRVSFDIPAYTTEVITLGTLALLEAARGMDPMPRFYHASSSEMFGSSPPPQSEDTPFRPRSPYGTAKLCAHWDTINYREGYGLFACCGILHNHESPRRGETFVTRKITRAVGRIKHGLQKDVRLGNLESQRDWGYAPDYVRAIWSMMQQPEPADYVIATGETHTVREFAELAFRRAGLDYQDHVVVDPRYYRPTDVEVLRGDASRARECLGWRPTVGFENLVAVMVDADMKLAEREARERG